MDSCGGAPPALSRELAHKSGELSSLAAAMDRAQRQQALHDTGGGTRRELWRVRLVGCRLRCSRSVGCRHVTPHEARADGCARLGAPRCAQRKVETVSEEAAALAATLQRSTSSTSALPASKLRHPRRNSE